MGGDRYTQDVPRPAETSRGAPPPWRSPSLSAEVVRGRLAPAALTTALRANPVGASDDASIVAAVLVPLLPHGPATGVLLTRRASTLRRDPLHVAFPGGYREPGETAVATALREAEEEIGLDPGRVEVIGALAPLERRRDSVRVLPVVGVVADPGELTLNRSEVEAVLEIPLAPLVLDGEAWQERWGDGEAQRTVRFFADPATLGRDLVWGLTAAMLWDLLERALCTDGA